MSKTYFIGDTHFGHNSISDKLRTQFSSDKDHDELIHNNVIMKEKGGIQAPALYYENVCCEHIGLPPPF